MNVALKIDQSCPLCGGANECRIANGCLYKDSCWCESNEIPTHVLRYLASQQPEPTCLCKRCLSAVARYSKTHDQPEEILLLVREELQMITSAVEDFYLDEQGRTVFTAAYHVKRGYCCDSGCRHCPYPKN